MDSPDAVKAFLGVGWAFTPCVTPDGRVALAQFDEDIRQAIRIILGTEPGERVMRPDFGAGLGRFVFEPVSATTLNLVKTRVREALVAWEPRIDVLDVRVTPDGLVRNTLLIDMSYRVRATNTQHNFVYPFYLQEGGGAVIPLIEPVRDDRDAPAIADEILRRRAGYVPEWQPAAKSAGNALAQIVARQLHAIVQRLNKAPDKHRLAFFDLLGFGLAPARPARAPIVLLLTEGAGDSAAPAGTQVSAPPPPGSSDQIVFETEDAVGVVAAKLAQVVSLWAGRDQYVDHSIGLAAGQPVTLFDHRQLGPTPHIVYLAHDRLLALTGTVRIDVELELSQGSSTPLDVRWEYWDGKVWRGFRGMRAACAGIAEDRLDTTFGLGRSGTFRLETDCAQAAPIEVNGIRAFWIRGRLADPLPPLPARALAEVVSIRLSSVITRPLGDANPPSGLLPDVAFGGGAKLNPTKAFYPFNHTPQAGTVFYFSSTEALGKPGANVEVAFVRAKTPTDDLGTPNIAHVVVWEYWNGAEWGDLGVPAVTGANPSDFNKSGRVRFVVPKDLMATKVNNQDGHWVRVRIVSGGYGSVNTVKLPAGSTPDSLTFAVTQPPVLDEFRIGYSWQNAFCHPEHALTFNDFTYEDRTFEAQWPGDSFQIFKPVSDATPAVYFGFDRPLPVDRVGLYFSMVEQPGGERGPALVWEYWNGSAWRDVSAEDETANLRTPGIVSVIGQRDSVALTRFDATRHWLRARLKEDGPPGEPVIASVRPNAVWASQRRTITDAALGASNGLPNQVFIFTQIPVLDGERIEVREIAGRRADVEWRILATELAGGDVGIVAALEADLAREGTQSDVAYGDIRLRRDRTKKVSEVWVRWQPRPHFHAAPPDARSYVLDRALGRLYFGDGQQGRIPPEGAAILARRFQSGGGAFGNVAAGAIAQMLGSAPGVQGVVNPRAAEGGSDGETLDAYARRMPATLAARGRAVTAADYEALAREASSAVAVAQAIPTRSQTGRPLAGWVTVRILPRSDEARPVPSFDLREEVAKYIAARAPAEIGVRRQIYVTGPDYLPIDVEATLAPVRADEAGEIERRAAAALQRFLHPLVGGPEGQGWRPGRHVYLSDVAAALGAVDGLDYVEDLALFRDGARQGERVVVAPDRSVVAGELRLKVEASRP